MQQGVTNPFLVMAINMTIVFGVLLALWGLISLTHLLDPTRKRTKKEPQAAPTPAAPAPAPAQPAVAKTDEGEIVAAITAAVVAMGYSSSQIATIRPHESRKWTLDGRLNGRRTLG